MAIILYDDFSNLRMEQFWPSSATIEYQDGIECLLGHGVGQTIGSNWFLWPTEHPGEVSEIRLEELGHKENEKIYVNIFAALGLPIFPGMEMDELTDVLGSPYQQSGWDGEYQSVEFRTDGVRYDISCLLIKGKGLQLLLMARSDRIAPHRKLTR